MGQAAGEDGRPRVPPEWAKSGWFGERVGVGMHLAGDGSYTAPVCTGGSCSLWQWGAPSQHVCATHTCPLVPRVQLCPWFPPAPPGSPRPFACWPVAKPVSVPGPPGACVPDSRGIAPSSSPSLCQEGREWRQAGAEAALLPPWAPCVCGGAWEHSWSPVRVGARGARGP